MHPQNLKPWRLYWPPPQMLQMLQVMDINPLRSATVCKPTGLGDTVVVDVPSYLSLAHRTSLVGSSIKNLTWKYFWSRIKAVTFDDCSFSEVRNKDKNDFGQHCCSKESFSDTDYTCTVTPSSKQRGCSCTFQKVEEVLLILHKLRILRTRATYIPFLINATLELTRNKGNVYHE